MRVALPTRFPSLQSFVQLPGREKAQSALFVYPIDSATRSPDTLYRRLRPMAPRDSLLFVITERPSKIQSPDYRVPPALM